MQRVNPRSYPFLTVDTLTKLLVWSKGIVHPRYDPSTIRFDICGNWMRFGEHGAQTEGGWEIDHIIPVSIGGSDDLRNLQPLWWKNNRRKGNSYPWCG